MITYSSKCIISFICILLAEKLMKWLTTTSLLYDPWHLNFNIEKQI